MKKHMVKIIVFLLNMAIATTGVFYLKEKDDKKKEQKRAQEKADMEEIAKFNIGKTQEILDSVKKEKQDYVDSNPGQVVIQKETTVQKTVPAVTKVIVEKKKVPVSSSTTKTS